jgi:hypothetical protein
VDLYRTKSSLALSWFVNTNEDVGDFRLELASLSQAMPKTVLVKDISYNTRYRGLYICLKMIFIPPSPF